MLLPEQLKTYWKTWEENTNEKSSIKINQDTYEQVAGLLRINITTEPHNALPVANPVSLRQQITAGERSADPEAEVDGWRIMQLLDKHSLRQSAMHFDYVHTATSSAQALVLGTVVPRKRPAPEEVDHQPPKIHKRKPRTCPREGCNRADCDGRFNSRPCSYPHG
jgi:hypothetical protein